MGRGVLLLWGRPIASATWTGVSITFLRKKCWKPVSKSSVHPFYVLCPSVNCKMSSVCIKQNGTLYWDGVEVLLSDGSLFL